MWESVATTREPGLSRPAGGQPLREESPGVHLNAVAVAAPLDGGHPEPRGVLLRVGPHLERGLHEEGRVRVSLRIEFTKAQSQARSATVPASAARDGR